MPTYDFKPIRHPPDCASYATVLRHFMSGGRFPISVGLLAKMTGVSKVTIVNWQSGRVRQPRRWQDVILVADAMRLSIPSTNMLLKAGGHPNIECLHADALENERGLFASWQQPSDGYLKVPET